MSGRLVLVATPIGNLEDISPRAARCLAEVDAIVAEDTRRARGLLSHLGIAGKPVGRLDAHSSPRALARVVERLCAGEQLALLSDAGTPTVSDPGAALVRAAVEAGVEVSPLPGPCAVTTALAASGMSADRFRFFGFLARKGAARRADLEQIYASEETVVLFESPRRIAHTLGELAERMPERPAVVAREMSKLYEQFLRGSLSELARLATHEQKSWRGEITLVLGPHQPDRERSRPTDEELAGQMNTMLNEGMRPRDVAKALARETGQPTRVLYRWIVEQRQRGEQ